MGVLLAILLKWLVLSSVFIAAAALVPGIHVRSWSAAFGAAAIFGLANLLLGWLLGPLATVLLFLPGILTLGLAFGLVPIAVNIVLLKITDKVIGEEMRIEGFSELAILAVAVALTAAFLFH